MTLAPYIHELLHRYDCVIVPGFGGFITNKIGATYQQKTNTFFPPTKKLAFNVNLKHNDGLLTNYIATAEGISFDEATDKIEACVQGWQQSLASSDVLLPHIGSLKLINNQLTFEPSQSYNYLTSAFGLSTIEVSKVARSANKTVALAPAKKEKGIPSFMKYAASAAVIMTLGFSGWTGYQNTLNKETYAKEQKALEQKIQSATFVIDKPLPTIELAVRKEMAKPYHIIAGSFQFEENAGKKVAQLKAKGFEAKILGKNKWGLTQVAFESHSDRAEAFKQLAAIRKSVAKDAWILIKALP